MDPRDSGRIARALDPLHAMAYFAPETEQHLTVAGLKPGRMCYFAGRAAPMGAVGPGVVAATFYNFNPALVARHIPAAWALAEPTTLVAARLAAVDAALRRMLGPEVLVSPEVAEAAGLARRAAHACCTDGRPLAAGHLDLEWPAEPHLILWHAVTILREHRGDGHIAALVGADLAGAEALVSHTATGRGFVVPFALASRGWSEEQWEAAAGRLRERGVLDAAAALTVDGVALRKRVEDDTNRLGAAPWAHLGPDGCARLSELGGSLVGALLAAGCFPKGVFVSH
ncbi:MAG: SCO6745 family protein [Pseudonocardia sp.]